jgi:Putative auto-transporter adhesin, head GIN domain
MKRKARFLFGISLLLMFVLACNLTRSLSVQTGTVRGSGDIVSEERPLSGVNSVNLAMQGDLTIELGDQEKIIVEAESNLLPYILTDVTLGELYIHTRSGTNLQNTSPIHYYLTVKSLEGLRISSSGNITAPDLTAQRFSVRISSSGEMNIPSLIADKLDVTISSSGNVTIGGGEVTQQEITISSSGDLYAQDMVSQDANVRISSSGDAYIRVVNNLDGSISSSGNIHYYGNPQIHVSSTSSGKVIKEGN